MQALIDEHGHKIDEGTAQCPVAHAPSQPLPPGHPPTKHAPASTLKPPTGERCVFFRTHEDLAATPPLSRTTSMQLDQIKAAANINPLAPGAGSTLDPNTSLVLASRNSQLALIQSSHVSAMLASHYGNESPAFAAPTTSSEYDTAQSSAVPTPPASPPLVVSPTQVLEAQQNLTSIGLSAPSSFPITSMSTAGDQNLRSPLYVIGGEGRAIWTKELEVALAGGAVDAIVHSLKDVPTLLPDGLTLAAILEREDPRDALVIKNGLPYRTLDELPPGSVIGTSSVRRVAQLRRRYPELVFSDIRGNLNTRLAKLDSPTGPYTALVLAAAGLVRLSLASRISAFLSAPVLMHSVGQGSLAIEVRTPPPGADPKTNREARIFEMIRSIGDWRATWRAEAERSLLRELEGGCSIPVGVETRFDDHDQIEGQRSEKATLEEVDRLNGLTGNVREAVQVEGHTIPASQMFSALQPIEQEGKEDVAGQRKGPAGLQRLTTGQAQNGVKEASSAPAVPRIKRMLPEDRATEPSEGAHLTLHAIVVSLDGTRDCGYELRKHCQSVEDARHLGEEVARELATKRGARVILDEVERHRKLAEEADDRRRQEEKAKRLSALNNGFDREGADKEELESRRKLDEALLAKGGENENGTRHLKEVDRRGLPRDDGQLKAWEV